MSTAKATPLKVLGSRPVVAYLLAALICFVAAAATLLFPPKEERPAPTTTAQARAEEQNHSSSARWSAEPTPRRERRDIPGRVVTATWYPVPPDSLAKRRAGEHEFTAAHNSLPLGTRVRVTHLRNGKSVVVRITDRGIHSRRVGIDLCKEAAEELAMLEQGVARVRLQVLRDEPLPVAVAAEASR